MFSIAGGMRRESSMFVKCLCQLIATKQRENLSAATEGIRCKISYELLRSSLLGIRGYLRSPANTIG